MGKTQETPFNKCMLCAEDPDEQMMKCASCDSCAHVSCCGAVSNGNADWKCANCLQANQHQGETSTLIDDLRNLTLQLASNGECDLNTTRTENPNLNTQPQTAEGQRMSNDIISNKKQLRLQQLEEEMRLEKEYLRRKYEILNNCDMNDDLVGNIETQQNKNMQPVNKFNAQINEQPLAKSQDNAANNLTSLEAARNTCLVSGERVQIPTFSNPGHQSTPMRSNVFEGVHSNHGYLTTTEMAARQSVPKDLPSFSGDPREWPIFISSFEQSTRVAGYTNDENLIRLQKCLHGKARDAVRNCLMLPDMVPDVIRTLKMYFGRPEHILKTLIERARKLPAPRGKLEPLIEYAFAVKNICATITASQLTEYLNNPTLLQEFTEKLGPDMLLNWAIYSKAIATPNLQIFSDWLFEIAEAACRVTTPVFSVEEDKKPPRRSGYLNVHKEASVKSTTDCAVCKGAHKGRCWFSKSCGVDGCTIKHNRLLHNASAVSEPSSNPIVDSTLNNHRSSMMENESYFRIVPVTLYGNLKAISTYAFMDDGSTLTLIEESVADDLGEIGSPEPLCIHWTGNVTRYHEGSRKFDLKISAAQPNSKIYPIRNVHTVKNLSMAAESMVADKIKQKFQYLKDIPLQSFTGAVPTIIIGINNPNLTVSLKVREGAWHEPIATKTRLGWTVFGGNGFKNSGSLHIHKCNCSCDSELHEMVKMYFSDENLGIVAPKKGLLSKENQQAIKILDDTCEFKDNRYVVGLLWKNGVKELPNSLPTAMQRMQCLKLKMAKDNELSENLQQQINNLITKGYATRLPADAINQRGGRIWYLPIFIVRNPHKPNKIRLVWDAAAKSSGYSLNDFLYKGPDLLKPLLNILFNFRMGAVAICGDIADMFHRIAVRKEDTEVQRFLWWDDNKNSFIVYKLNVLTFGASCSPCIAHYVRDKNALLHTQNPRAVQAICEHHYVDDFIDSTQTPQEAIALAKAVRDIHAKGGFHMRNWASNSRKVLNALDTGESVGSKTFSCNENQPQYEKILGMHWEPKLDTFNYILKFVRLKRNVLNSDAVPTKREVLQVLMSIFDPLGFVSCITSNLKIILQEIWRNGIDWDQQLTIQLNEKWLNWISYLPMITNVAIPRCYSLEIYNEDCNVQLHTFVDASENAFAAVSYFRIQCREQIELRLVAAKSKVAPLRPLSIARLELQAAVVGVRLMTTICNGHKLRYSQRVLWTDSKTVLKWLQNDSRQFQQFVMFRVAEIQDLSKLSEWRWVPSKLNVADVATKNKTGTNVYNEWFNGPDFLMQDESEWPKNPDLGDLNTCEVRPRFMHIRHSIKIKINYEYFSSWYRLYRAVANWILYIERLRKKIKKDILPHQLTVQHFIQAKAAIYKEIQMESYNDEWTALKLGKIVSKSQTLGKLNLYLDNDEIIRVKNRAAYLPSNIKQQPDFIALSAQHPVTRLIVRYYHQAFHHINHETAINEVRQTYYIPKLRPLFKIIRRQCQICKINNAKPQPPRLAPLPRARLGAFMRPFTFIGIDYFGPVMVTVDRKNRKRWGVLITCLTTRAVHIEIAHSLSTDSCLMCLRNFIARRGSPTEIYSDNGTNFIGAEKILREELKNLNAKQIQLELAHKGISWKFNPPAAPHMGGAWERMIRSVKAVLYKISPSQRFTDESLRSALMEVEMTINSRPLTFVSLETEDQEAVTPNHFLLGSSNGAKPFCDPENIDYKMCLRQSEAFANMFWRRWLIEMLPTFTRRSKWFQHVKPIAVGDIVLIIDENFTRNTWLKGRVVETILAKDGQVRRAKIQTSCGILERPAVKLAVLDIGNMEDKLSPDGHLSGGAMLPKNTNTTHNTATQHEPADGNPADNLQLC